MKARGIHKLAWILLIIGGINWGLVGFFQYNLVDAIFGIDTMIARVIYALVGLSAVDGLLMMFRKK